MNLESRARILRRLGTVSLVLTVCTMGMGSWTKATGSGLSCPDWPSCYGKYLPPFPSRETGGLHAGYTPGNDTADRYYEWQVLSEWSHRALASFLGLPVLAFAALALTGKGLSRNLRLVGGLTLLMLVIQGLLGGATVKLGNKDWVTTLHLVTATLFLLIMTIATCIAFLKPLAPAPPAPPEEPKPVRFAGFVYPEMQKPEQ
jgi:cytochrome c oxidase assembly protein subunit 15